MKLLGTKCVGSMSACTAIGDAIYINPKFDVKTKGNPQTKGLCEMNMTTLEFLPIRENTRI